MMRTSILTGVRRADREHLALLDRAEQLGLQRDRHLGDLVEQQRAALGRTEQAVAGAGCAGEGALGMAEQDRLEHRVGQRCAIDRNERLVGARRRGMDEAGDALLAGAGLAEHEHGRVRAGDLFGELEIDRALGFADRRADRGAAELGDQREAERHVLEAEIYFRGHAVRRWNEVRRPSGGRLDQDIAHGRVRNLVGR